MEIAWEHRRMSEREDLRDATPTKDTIPLIWTLQQQREDRIRMGNYDLDTLATLEPDPDGVMLT